MTEQEEMAYRGMGFDAPRIWSNQVQVTVSGNLAQLLFRETGRVQIEEDGEFIEVNKNVAAILLPVDVLAGMHGILNRLRKAPEEPASENAEGEAS